jgi:thiosulfate/3-mercaptopyruvate sulfurtransferase
MKLVVSNTELKALSDKHKKNLLIVDTRPFSDYAVGHVPDAVNIDLMQFHWIDTTKVGIAQFNKQMKILISNIGITKNKSVVFYDNVSGPSAARGVWLLLYFSHNKVAMLDGGFEKWKKIGHEVETKSNQFIHSNFEGRPNSKILADFKQVKSAVHKKNVNVIIDARSKSEYNGSTIRSARAGHIPTAINIDWNSNIEKDIFKQRIKMGQIYSQIPKHREVITYCQGGYRAANTFVVLKMLGYENVKVYLGSWGEWGNRLELPVEK